ncbi:hypothetical protein [Olivibacter sitiensis]|uniref:hypothetical protein n=1 Tax=Olivibacter sitiensis TaxID=376470 RepID=UPI0003F4D879|nr:hypothetical protein [Olivibacter sitiensis]
MKKNFIFSLAALALSFLGCEQLESQLGAQASTMMATVEDSRISLDEARTLVANYGRAYGQEGLANLQAADTETRAVFMPRRQLEQLVADMEATDGDGVRFYFARYDSGSPKNTLVIVPTKAATINGVAMHRDVYGETDTAGNITQSYIQNRMHPCPPCDDADLVEGEEDQNG